MLISKILTKRQSKLSKKVIDKISVKKALKTGKNQYLKLFDHNFLLKHSLKL